MQKKHSLHPRNLHRKAYDFVLLCEQNPALIDFVKLNPNGQSTINFANPVAIKTLNQTLLKVHYGISKWDIPSTYLCPPIPGRVDYIHYLADLLAVNNQKNIPKGKKVKVLDIGTGANVIYPLLGHAVYGWTFVGTDIKRDTLLIAQKNLDANPSFSKVVELRLQEKLSQTLIGVLKKGEIFDLTMCNPPFHSSATEAQKGTNRKWKNLGKPTHTGLNYGGQANELWCEGGELSFILRLIKESKRFASSCLWFTTLVSKKEHLTQITKELKSSKVNDLKIISMTQGQKKSRFVAWSFLNPSQREVWKKYRW